MHKKIFLLGCYHDEIIINNKTLFLYGWKSFWIIWHQKWFYYFAKCGNLFIYMFCFTSYSNSLKWYISILQEKPKIKFPKEHVLHDFTKHFSGTRKSLVNIYLNGSLSRFCTLLFSTPQEMFTKLWFDKKIKEKLRQNYGIAK